MRIFELLKNLQKELEAISDSPLIEAEQIICHVLKFSPTMLSKEVNADVSKSDLERIQEICKNRLNGTPLSHILGFKSFYSNDFIVNNSVLIPRPETELLVELALQKINSQNGKTAITEIGMGSGCLILSVLYEIYTNANQKDKEYYFFGSEISADAFLVTKANLKNIFAKLKIKKETDSEIIGTLSENLHFHFELNDLLPKALEEFLKNANLDYNLLISNPPYIKSDELFDLDLDREPLLALDGGREGLDVYTRILKQTKRYSFNTILFEIHEDNKLNYLEMLKSFGITNEEYLFHKDLNHKDRFLEINN